MQGLTLAKFITLFALLGVFSGCGQAREDGASELQDVTDIASMQRQADGTFAVICNDGRREVATAAQIRAGQVCMGGNVDPNGIYCKQTNNAGVFSPARTSNGAWLDDGPGTSLAACQQQLARAYSGYYCRQTRNNANVFSPARTSDGGWLDDSPGTDLDSCVTQIASIDYAAYCRQITNNPTRFSPARPTNAAWLDDAPGTDLNTCGQQLSDARTGLYCRQLSNNPGLFSPARISDGGWLDNAPGTSLDVCLQQI